MGTQPHTLQSNTRGIILKVFLLVIWLPLAGCSNNENGFDIASPFKTEKPQDSSHPETVSDRPSQEDPTNNTAPSNSMDPELENNPLVFSRAPIEDSIRRTKPDDTSGPDDGNRGNEGTETDILQSVEVGNPEESGPTDGKGKVVFYLADSLPEMDLQALWVTPKSLVFVPADDGLPPVTFDLSHLAAFDLLRYHHGAMYEIGLLELPTGHYDEVHLLFPDAGLIAETVTGSQTPVIIEDNAQGFFGTIDLNIVEGKRDELVMHIDVESSLTYRPELVGMEYSISPDHLVMPMDHFGAIATLGGEEFQQACLFAAKPPLEAVLVDPIDSGVGSVLHDDPEESGEILDNNAVDTLGLNFVDPVVLKGSCADAIRSTRRNPFYFGFLPPNTYWLVFFREDGVGVALELPVVAKEVIQIDLSNIGALLP